MRKPVTPADESLPSQARVVIIGGGIMGCGLAYHLAHEGWTDCVLFEKGELTSGSTWHAAGQITHSTSSYSLGQCVAYNVDLYQRLEAETGQSVTWHGCGSLRLAYEKDEEDWLRHTLSVGKNLQFPMQLISPDDIRRLHPFYNLDGVRVALHTPEDGHVDPAGTTFALAKGARQLGARIIRHCRVTEAEQSNGEWLLRTEKGDIRCQHLVNAGGTYARQMALSLGYDLPATSMTHHYFVTEPVAEFADLEKELPVVRDDRLVSGYIRMEQKSGLIGIYEKANPNAVWLDGTPWESENELFDADYDRIMPWLEAAMQRMPILADAGIRREVHGAISHPPDGNPLIGPAPALPNYWCCCGCQIGVGWGPGLTRELARWMVHGAADISMREYDPRRFGPYADAIYQRAKAKEDYLLRHEIPFPHYNRPACRPIKKSPLYEKLKAKRAVFEEVYGWERPRWFAPPATEAKDIYSFRRSALHDIIAAEVRAVREHAGIIDISAFAKIIVEGKDSATFVDRLTANTLPPASGRITLTHLLTESGRIELETTVARLAEDRFYFVCAAFFEQRLTDLLQAAKRKTESLTIINRSQEWGAIALNGPKARDILSACTPHPLDNATFPWLRAQDIHIGEGTAHALRLSYAGELGWELHGEAAIIERAYTALSAAGQPHGLRDYGSFAMNAMRMEKAFPGAGELTNEVTAPEADIMRFVNLKKDFIGKAATLTALQKPPRWRLLHLQVDGDNECDGHGGEPILADGERVGAISSIAHGHHVNRLLAFGYARPGYEDKPLTVMIMGEERPARVLTQAAHDPQNLLPKR